MDSDTIGSFCAGEKISRSQLYKMWKQGRGPRLFYVGNRRHISAEARREWRLMLEAEAAERDNSSRGMSDARAQAAA